MEFLTYLEIRKLLFTQDFEGLQIEINLVKELVYLKAAKPLIL